jgi:hypothetical protein
VFRDRASFAINESLNIDKATELKLMTFYIEAPDRYFDVTDRQNVAHLYERYLKLPGSLREDQRALIYACLCRSCQLHGDGMQPFGNHYFALATRELEQWNRPSVTAIGMSANNRMG